MPISQFIKFLKDQPQKVSFDQAIQIINDNYDYTPSTFFNGLNEDKVTNEAGSNEGSCKIFAFGLTNELNKEETLSCFGDYYRNDVLKHPNSNDHANIRTFMIYGWAGIKFENNALTEKS
jgi:hypothetical protein